VSEFGGYLGKREGGERCECLIGHMNAMLTEEHSNGNENLGEPGAMTGGQDLYSFPGCLSSPPCFTKNLLITFCQE